MQCTKCKATWTYGPTDICPICTGKVSLTPAEKKETKTAPHVSQSKSWWEFR